MGRMFVRKRIGWGITPGDWRGWGLTLGYIVAIAVIAHVAGGLAAATGIGILTLVFVAFVFWAFVNEI